MTSAGGDDSFLRQGEMLLLDVMRAPPSSARATAAVRVGRDARGLRLGERLGLHLTDVTTADDGDRPSLLVSTARNGKRRQQYARPRPPGTKRLAIELGRGPYRVP